LWTIHDEDEDAEVGVSFNPFAILGEPTESQVPPAAHSDIIYNTSGNPIARTSGEILRAESAYILGPVLRTLQRETAVAFAQQPVASGSGSRGASQSTSSSQGRKKIRFGSYDPADDLVSWDNPADPNRDRTGETTGPQLFTPEQEELQRRVNNVLHNDDEAGNLEFGKSRQTLLDGVVRPLSEIRATSASASPTRHVVPPPPAQATTSSVLPTTAGPSIGDEPANPLIIDGDSPPASPSSEQLRIAARYYVRTEDARVSEEETSRPSGDSFVVIPDSQEQSPPLLSQPAAPPNDLSKSTKTTDPRRRPPTPMVDNGIHACSQAGPSRSQPKSPSETPASHHPSEPTKNRTAWQLNSAKPYVGSPKLSMRFATPPELSTGCSTTTPAPQVVSPLPAGSSARSEAEAVPCTPTPQRQVCITCWGFLYSPIYPTPPRALPVHGETVCPLGSPFVPDFSASTAEGGNIMGTIGEPARMPTSATQTTPIRTNRAFNACSPVATTLVAQSEQGSDDRLWALYDRCDYTQWQLPSINKANLHQTEGRSSPETQIEQPSSGKRKQDEEATEPVQESADKPSPSKRARNDPAPPAPLPAESAEPIRCTRSFTARSSKPPTSHGPLMTPMPPPRLPDAGRSRKRTAVPRTPSPQPQRKATLHSIIETSSPLSPLPSSSPVREVTVSPTRRSKTYLKGRTLVPDSSASTVEGGEVLGTSGEQVETQTSATQATPDPFKSLARSASKSKLGKRKASATLCVPYFLLCQTFYYFSCPLTILSSPNPFLTTKSMAATPKPSTRKRAREESPEDDPFNPADLSPPPSKKHRREASVSTAVQTRVASKTGKPPVASPAAPKQRKSGARFVSSPQRACQQGGRVFAPWKQAYYTATVKNTWEDEEEIMCKVHFDDNTWGEIPLSSLYRCELREGDKVKVPGLKGKKLGRDGYVSAVPLWEERYRVSVHLATVPQEEVAIFDGKKIAVEADLVRKEWKDRKVMTLEDIGLGEELIRVQEEKERKEAEAKAIGRTIPSAAFLGPPRWKDSPPPPPRHTSLPSRGRKRPPPANDDEAPATAHKRRRLEAPWTSNHSPNRPFTDHLFIHALAVNNDKGNPLEEDQRAAQKQELTATIERLGGKVVDGFSKLLRWGGNISDDSHRWVWDAGDIQHVKDEPSAPTTTRKRGTGSPPSIFLVTDGPNRTTKYLMALAAGIPCVDQGWVHDEVSVKYVIFSPLTNYYVRMSFRGTRTFFQQANPLA
jgi:hypothetical protein